MTLNILRTQISPVLGVFAGQCGFFALYKPEAIKTGKIGKPYRDLRGF